MNKSETINTNNDENNAIKNFQNFCAPHHLNNKLLIGYPSYLKNKQEGRWLVYSWAALLLQPMFFIFYKMYFLGFLYSLLFGFLFGLNYVYGIALLLVFPLFAFKIYEIHTDNLFLKSLNKFQKFEKKYITAIELQTRVNMEIEKIEKNTKISERKKIKKKNSLLRSLKWNYKLLSPYTYFNDKVQPLKLLSFIPVSIFAISFYSLFSFSLFTVYNPLGQKIKEVIVSEFEVNQNNEHSEIETQEILKLQNLNNLSEIMYKSHEQYFVDSILDKRNLLSNDSYLKYFRNIINNPPSLLKGSNINDVPLDLSNSAKPDDTAK